MTAAIEQTDQAVSTDAVPVEPDAPSAEQATAETGDQPSEEAAPADEKPAESAGTVAVQPPGFLAIEPGQRRLTADQRTSLSAIGITDDYDVAQIRVFIHFCQVRKLDPWAKEAYLIKRKGRSGDSYSIQTSIDTYRRKAFETKRYRRKVGVYWTGPENDPNSWIVDPQTRVRYRVWDDVWLRPGNPAAAKCVIEYYDERGEIVQSEAIANWDMFVGTTWKNNEKVPNEMWAKGGAHMLAKCAEALSLRQAFPTTLSGLYIQEEMSHLDSEANSEYMERLVAKRREAFAKAQAARVDEGGDVVEGTIVGKPADEAPDTDGPAADDERQWLMEELDEQARILGQSRVKLLNRLTVAHRCNPEDLPVEALRPLVLSLRPLVGEAMESRNAVAGAELYRTLPPSGHAGAKAMLDWVAGPAEGSDQTG
ncbi:recombinase RecT [Micromonospora sp. NPDC006766]|uniref:recombinase RecT n=1 Tax=Micromonospora sp. NPDC006766 TaxID=3154778 RepID=UPI00340F6218